MEVRYHLVGKHKSSTLIPHFYRQLAGENEMECAILLSNFDRTVGSCERSCRPSHVAKLPATRDKGSQLAQKGPFLFDASFPPFMHAGPRMNFNFREEGTADSKTEAKMAEAEPETTV